MDHDDYKLMLAPLALGALEPTQAQSAEEHIGGCATCRGELDELRDIGSALALLATPAEPSSQLRSRILEAVQKDRREQQKVVPLAKPARPLTRPRWFGAAQAIAAVIMIAFIIGLLLLWSRNTALQATITQLNQRLQETSARLEHEQIAIQVLTTPGAKMAELAGTAQAPTAHAMIAVDGKTRRAVFMAQGLPQAPAGKAYQLWFISGSKPMPGKVFKTDSAGNAMMMDEDMPADALAAATFAVTLEPQQGVAAPTGSMYLISPSRPTS